MRVDPGSEPMLSRSPRALWRTTLDGVLISPDDDTDPVLCTAPGDIVWDLLAQPVTRAQLVARLSEIYDVDPHAIAADIAPLIRTLLTAGALTES